jgi:diguanylate cyclase (GGDEF)-like protein
MTEYLKDVFAESGKDRYWLAITDLDDFKLFNDTYGHNCGDYVLVTIANLLRSPSVKVCRWGGEEFLLVGKTVTNGPIAMLQQIRQSVHDYNFQFDNNQLHVTMTIGMSWLEPGMTLDQWISSADEKLYEGKTSGKNKLCA